MAPSRPTTSGRTLLNLTRAHLAERRLDGPVYAVTVSVVEEGEPEPAELDLFDRAPASPDEVDRSIARLRAVFGGEAAFAARLVDRHRPEGAYEWVPFVPPQTLGPRPPKKKKKRTPSATPPLVASAGVGVVDPGALRLLDPPRPLPSLEEEPAPARLVSLGGPPRRIVTATGPTRLQSEWWTPSPLARDYYEIETDDGARFWLFRDHGDGRFYLHGVFD